MFKSSDGGQRKMGEGVQYCNWSNTIYIDEAVFYAGDVTYKNCYLKVKSIQSKEQELTLNAMYLA